MFILLSIITAALVLFWCWALLKSRQEPGRLPRLKWPGVALGIPCLVWSAWHACEMLEGDLARFHPLVWLLVPVSAILCAWLMDYLFARATGGFLILAANELIHGAFVHAVPVRPLFSAVCLLLGVAGMFLIASPWHLRNLLERAPQNARRQRVAAGALVFAAATLFLLPLFS
ncbi:MAG: hypothetical protein IJJ33_20460 [Victivallales bacterium]|nr:hypothetical protein [Victivallales bacterium]